MAKKKTKTKTTLLQLTVQPDLKERVRETPEYKLHQNFSAALRAILDRVLPKVG